jgi:hypothetical protein
MAAVPEHERTLGPRRLATREQSDRQDAELLAQMFPPGWRERLDAAKSKPVLDLSELSVTDEHMVVANRLLGEKCPADLSQSPLLRGILAVGTPIELAVPTSSEVSANPDLQQARRDSGDLVVGIAVGFALRASEFEGVSA